MKTHPSKYSKIFHKCILLILLSVSITGLNSCKKYPDGPDFSLRTKKARLTGTWELDKALVNNVDQTTLFLLYNPGYTVDIKKDETYTATTNNGTIDNGKWEFTNSKEHVKTTSTTTPGTVTDHKILKLENKALWLKSTDATGNTIELHLEAK